MNELLTLPSVTYAGRTNLPRRPGIYFVFAGDTLLYIGKAVNLYNRWQQQHHKLPELPKYGDFRIAWIQFDQASAIHVVEDSLINFLKPPLNRQFKKMVEPEPEPSADFGYYHYGEFLDWCFFDRQSKAVLLRNLVIARTDANQELLERKRSFYARIYKLSPEALRQRIFDADSGGVSVVELHRRLAEEVNENRRPTL